MRNGPQCLRHDAAKRWCVCDGKFGLIRHYSWRTPLCSKKCANRLKARRKPTADGYDLSADHGRSENNPELSRRSDFRTKEAAQ